MLEYYENWYTEAQNIFTIGSNGKKIPEFIEILKKNGVETVLDVRKSATSSHEKCCDLSMLHIDNTHNWKESRYLNLLQLSEQATLTFRIGSFSMAFDVQSRSQLSAQSLRQNRYHLK
jgi:hypothetical protein